MATYDAKAIEPNYTYWAAFNEGTLDPEMFGLSLVRFRLQGEWGELYNDFRPGETPCIYLRDDPDAKPGEVVDVPEPVIGVVTE